MGACKGRPGSDWLPGLSLSLSAHSVHGALVTGTSCPLVLGTSSHWALLASLEGLAGAGCHPVELWLLAQRPAKFCFCLGARAQLADVCKSESDCPCHSVSGMHWDASPAALLSACFQPSASWASGLVSPWVASSQVFSLSSSSSRIHGRWGSCAELSRSDRVLRPTQDSCEQK